VEQPAEIELPAFAVSEGDVVERNAAAVAIARSLGRRFARWPGAALFLDYGPAESGPGDSLQAIADGRPADPLARPGEADLTAHVDFGALKAAVADAAVYGPAPQGMFLARLGLLQRANRLAQGQTPEAAYRIMAAARRLTEPDRMGRLFKALAVMSPGTAVAAGFEEDSS
jgi:SAM-dependent MidA family methyltransferase